MFVYVVVVVVVGGCATAYLASHDLVACSERARVRVRSTQKHGFSRIVVSAKVFCRAIQIVFDSFCPLDSWMG